MVSGTIPLTSYFGSASASSSSISKSRVPSSRQSISDTSPLKKRKRFAGAGRNDDDDSYDGNEDIRGEMGSISW